VNPWKGLTGLPRPVWMLSLSTLVNRLGTLVIFFLALYLVQGRGWREEDAASAMLAYGLGAVLAGPFSGPLSDRIGHRRLLLGSLIASGVGIFLVPFVQSKPVFLLLIGLWSAVTQAFWPASMALITDMTPPEQRKQAFVLHRLASNLGLAIGPAAGGFIAHWSYTSLFWIDGTTTLLGALVLAWGVQPVQEERAKSQVRSHSAWRDRRLLGLLLLLTPAIMVFTQIHGTLPLWVSRDLGHGPGFFGLVFTLNTALILLLEVELNLRTAAWTHGRQLALGALLIGAGFGLTGLARPIPMLALTVMLWTFGEMILLPATSDAVAALAPADRRGEYMGLYSLAWTVAMTLGPWLGLVVYARSGPGWLWAGCGVAALVSAAALLRFRTHSPVPAA